MTNKLLFLTNGVEILSLSIFKVERVLPVSILIISNLPLLVDNSVPAALIDISYVS